MKKIDGRSTEAKAKKARSDALFAKRSKKAWDDAAAAHKAEADAQYAAQMQTHADGSFTGMTGKTYKPMEFTEPTASSRQIGGDHYQTNVQPWDAMQAWMSPEAFAGFLRGSAIKYIARCDKKGGREDIQKAHHYLEKLLEVGV